MPNKISQHQREKGASTTEVGPLTRAELKQQADQFLWKHRYKKTKSRKLVHVSRPKCRAK